MLFPPESMIYRVTYQLPSLIWRHLYYFILLYTTLYYLSIPDSILLYNSFEVIFVKPLKEKISITIDSDILAKLRISAENDDRSLSQYINIILKSYVHKENSNNHLK